MRSRENLSRFGLAFREDFCIFVGVERYFLKEIFPFVSKFIIVINGWIGLVCEDRLLFKIIELWL